MDWDYIPQRIRIGNDTDDFVIIFIKIICGSDSEKWEMGAKIAIKPEPGCV